MENTERTLEAILYRLECPSKMDLGEYGLGLLDDIFRRNEIASHMATCPHCQVDLVQMRRFMDLPLVDEALLKTRKEEKLPLLERIKVIVVDLLTPPAGLESAPLQLAMRGETQDMSTRVFHIDPYVIALSAMKEPSSWQRQHIIGDIIPATDDEENFQHWTIYLWRAGKLLATSAVDRDSHFFFEDVQVDTKPHDLILSGPKVEIHLQNLQMA